MIEIRGLSKSYDKGRVQAVKNLDLTVQKGELFGFLGPNGAGKTTTLKVLVGLLKPDAGTVLLGGVDVRRDPLKAKALFGYCPDEPVLYDKMTGARFLASLRTYTAWPGGAGGTGGRARRAFEMKDALGDVVASYSHGMRQKLSLMAALLHDPQILILDEPIVGLDPRAAFTLKETMRGAVRRGQHRVLLDAHHGDRREAVRQGRHHQPRRAASPRRPSRSCAGRPARRAPPWRRCSWR